MQRQITEFLGPIFAKEVIEIARRARYFICRTLYGAILVFVMFVAWEEAQAFSRATGTAGSSNALARLAAMVFSAASYVQFWSVYLLVPAFLCGVIAGEREEQTLDLFFITPLSDREIVLGKLFSRVAAMVCLILCGVPVVSLLMLFGGISPESIWRMLAATLLAILFTGSHAVYFSVIARAPMEALARTYVALFLWLAGLAILAWGFREACQSMPWLLPPELVEYLGPVYLAYPLVSFWGAVNEGYVTSLRLIYGAWVWEASFVVPAMWSIFLLWRAVRRLRQLPRARVDWKKSIPWARYFQRQPRPEQVARRSARAAKDWFGREVANPLWLRARLTRVYDRAGSIARLKWLGWFIVLFGFLMMAVFAPGDLGKEGASVMFQTPTWGVLGMVTCLVAGHSLIGDRRRGFLEQVIVTPLSGREIVDGTFLALWEHLRALFWLPLALAVFFCISGGQPVSSGFICVITAALFCTLLAWQGLACSLAARTTPGAVVGSFLLPMTAVFVVPTISGPFRENHAPYLWTAIGAWFAVTWFWTRYRKDAAAIGCYLTALHLVLVAVAECWTRHERHAEFPMAAMNPVFQFVAPQFERNQGGGGFDNYWARHWAAIVGCYWAALVLNIVLVRRFVVRHFDTFVDRMPSKESEERVE